MPPDADPTSTPGPDAAVDASADLTPDAALHAALGITPGLLAGRGLRRYPEARELVAAVTTASGRRILLAPAACAAWHRLQEAAATDGITLWILSGYRSRERQAELIRARLDRGESLESILRVLAPPGCSEHHTGRAVDVTVPGLRQLQREFADGPAYAWLCANAGRFGFRLSYPEGNASGYDFEPWHWCHHG